jgi:osmotically-inducible protein OsmY
MAEQRPWRPDWRHARTDDDRSRREDEGRRGGYPAPADEEYGRYGRGREEHPDRGMYSGRSRDDHERYASADFGEEAYGPGFVGNEGRGYGYGYGGEGYRGYNDESYGGGAYGSGRRGWWGRTADQMASWFGDEEAQWRLEQDHRGRGPKGYRRCDDRILEDVSGRLADDPRVDASEIEVGVSGGEVTLSGTVDSREARRRAEDVAERVSGVAYVQNNLRVARQDRG